MTFINNSSTTIYETWFISFDISMIVCLSLAILLGSVFLLIIVLDKTCHTIPMMLLGNSCLAQIIFASNILIMSIVALQNDLKQINYQDSFCIFRGYLSYVLYAIMNYSFLLQSNYQYVTVAYPTRLFWQSMKCQILLVCITWIFGFIYPLAFIFTGDIIYNVDNQLCQIPLRLSFSLIYMIFNTYIMPVLMIQLMYLKLLRYVKLMRKRVTTRSSLSRIQKELKMVRRIVITVTILITLGLPYTLFAFMSFVSHPPKYHFRIAAIFITTSLVFVMIALFKFTDTLKSAVFERIHLLPTVWYR